MIIVLRSVVSAKQFVHITHRLKKTQAPSFQDFAAVQHLLYLVKKPGHLLSVFEACLNAFGIRVPQGFYASVNHHEACGLKIL